MRRFRLLFLALFLSIAGLISAQDIHFSQFYMSPLNLNPAMTGVMNCNNRLIVNYRNQWAGVLGADAYNTFSASYDQKITVGRSDYFGLGGSLWGDVAGESRFGTMQGRISFSFAKRMGGYRKSAQYLVFGADAGITQRRVREADLQWPSQHDGNGGFDPSIGSGETIIDNDFLWADLAAGLMWFSVMDEYNNYYIGAAIHHLNQANVSFLGQDVNIYSKITLHGGGQFETSPKMSVLPGFVYMMQGPHREFNGGASLRFAMGSTRLTKQFFQLGAWYRLGTKVEGGIHSDAMILSARFDYDNYGIGFSYDLNVSKLKNAAAGNGSFEFSLNYLICGPERRSVYCPRF
jgi:type IX secretion system PorP/SprF family membrane protein